jgi:hypothetical protein
VIPITDFYHRESEVHVKHSRKRPLILLASGALLLSAAAETGSAESADSGELSADDQTLIEQLESIGYLEGTRPAPDATNVVRYDSARAYAGLNLLTSGHGPEAVLMDMEGTVLHRWSAGFDALYPDRKPAVPAGHPGRKFWRRVALYPNGDLLVIFEGIGLAKLNAASQPIWAAKLGAHHDLEVLPDGTIYVLTRKAGARPGHNQGRPILEDFIVVLDADGRVQREVSLFDALLSSPYAEFYTTHPSKGRDPFHTNTLQVLGPGPGARPPGFEPGRVLVAFPMIDATALVDLDEERVVWADRGGYRFHHDPSLLANGRLLLFDNKGNDGKSRVIELDPVTGEVAWEYEGTPERPLDSPTSSTAQRLPNGNTLITESEAGRALEITAGGETVWEFVSPYRAGEDGELVAALFEVLRLPAGLEAPWATLTPSCHPGSNRGPCPPLP